MQPRASAEAAERLGFPDRVWCVDSASSSSPTHTRQELDSPLLKAPPEHPNAWHASASVLRAFLRGDGRVRVEDPAAEATSTYWCRQRCRCPQWARQPQALHPAGGQAGGYGCCGWWETGVAIPQPPFSQDARAKRWPTRIAQAPGFGLRAGVTGKSHRKDKSAWLKG